MSNSITTVQSLKRSFDAIDASEDSAALEDLREPEITQRIVTCAEVLDKASILRRDLATVESFIGLDGEVSALVCRQIEALKKTKDEDDVGSLDMCRTLSFKAQSRFLGSASITLDKIERLLEKHNNAEEITEEEKLKFEEFQTIGSYARFFPTLKQIKNQLAEGEELPEKFENLYQLCQRAHLVVEELNRLIAFEYFPTGSILFNHETKKKLLSLASEGIYNRDYLYQKFLSGSWSEIYNSFDCFLHDVIHFQPWKLQPFFTGPYTHTTLITRENNDTFGSSIFDKFYHQPIDFEEVLISDAYKLNIEGLLTDTAKALIEKHPTLNGRCQTLFEEALLKTLRENLDWFQAPGHMMISEIRGTAAAFSSEERSVKRRKLNVNQITMGLIPLQGETKFNIPLVDIFLMRKEKEPADRFEKGVELRHEKSFCSEYVGRMITAASYRADLEFRKYLKKRFDRPKFYRLHLNRPLIRPCIPNDCRFQAITPNSLAAKIAPFAEKLPPPRIVQALFKQNEDL